LLGARPLLLMMLLMLLMLLHLLLHHRLGLGRRRRRPPASAVEEEPLDDPLHGRGGDVSLPLRQWRRTVHCCRRRGGGTRK
jgi:hypothetical protein